MDLSLRDRRAVVCGSTQGIGRAAAVELALLGAGITLIARNPETLATVCLALPKIDAGQHHAWLAADFGDLEAVRAVARTLAADARGVQHILVNNTGGPAAGAVLDAPTDQFASAFNAHVLAGQLLAQALVPGMKSAGYGRIINVISTSVKAPIPNLGVSNTIRAAMAAWAKTLAGEVGAYGITVNNVLPGYTRTGRLDSLVALRAAKAGVPAPEIEKQMAAEVPAGRFGTPEELGAAIAFLATPAAAYINGINLPVDGGRSPSL